MNNSIKKFIALTIATGIFSGCSQSAKQEETSQSILSDIPVIKDESIIETSATTTEPSVVAEYLNFNSKQKNSLMLLNYLSVLTYEINTSNNNRIYLDDVYSFLYNNVNLNVIDEATKEQLESLRDTIATYRMLDVKKERIEYIYENKKWTALKKAIPNPNELLSVNSTNKSSIVISIVNLAFGSYKNYADDMEGFELESIKDDWMLNDEELKAIHEIRESTLGYLIDVANKHKLPDELILRESDIEEFVNAKNNTNIASRIQFLESNVDKYKCLGSYWILLADSYYSNGDYQECLDAISVYQELSPQIYRKDKELASVLPKIIDAASKILSNDEYINYCKEYCEQIIDNTDNKDWDLRYFAAIAYIDLYHFTNNTEYLKLAYDIALNNVNYCKDEQIEFNKTYLTDIKEIEIPKDATKRSENEIKQYNKDISEIRKTELPPVSEPLYANCELLFALAEELNINETEKDKIDSILHGNEHPVFLTIAPENQFSFKNQNDEIDLSSLEISFDGKKINLPANLLTNSASIVAVIKDEENNTKITDWEIKKVERVNKNDITTFIAHYSSEEIQNIKYTENSTITITVTPKSGSEDGIYSFEFKANPTNILFLQTGFEFERIK